MKNWTKHAWLLESFAKSKLPIFYIVFFKWILLVGWFLCQVIRARIVYGNDWIQSVDHGYPTDVIYFDFCMIFNTVSNARLLLKLEFSNFILMQSHVLELTEVNYYFLESAVSYHLGNSALWSMVILLSLRILLVVFSRAQFSGHCCLLFMSITWHLVSTTHCYLQMIQNYFIVSNLILMLISCKVILMLW